MGIKLSFLGAAGNVTGSRYLIETASTKVLIDCGLYQERHFQERNYKPFQFAPSAIDAVILTHAHLDHCGLLPKLAADGFAGSVFATPATCQLAEIVMLDSAHIQTEDAKYKARRHEKEGRKDMPVPVPLYTTEDAQAAQRLFKPTAYGQKVRIADGISAVFHDAGHILGAATVNLEITDGDRTVRVLFTGDIGRPNRPIISDPATASPADYVITESTYGDRDHPAIDTIKQQFADAINTAVKAGGNIVIPSFAIERSQEILYYISELIKEHTIEPLKVFLDSPMAVRATKVFTKHPELFDDDMKERMAKGDNPFNFRSLTMTSSPAQSKKINDIRGTICILSGSGMCTGGRIKHHLVTNITRPESVIIFAGYQAEGTLGRLISEGESPVRILGKQYDVKAKVIKIAGLSAHADRTEIADWLGKITPAPKKVFICHGETSASHAFGEFLSKRNGYNIVVPEYNDSIAL